MTPEQEETYGTLLRARAWAEGQRPRLPMHVGATVADETRQEDFTEDSVGRFASNGLSAIQTAQRHNQTYGALISWLTKRNTTITALRKRWEAKRDGQ